MAEINPKIAEDFINSLNEMGKAFSDLKNPIEGFTSSFSKTTSTAKDMVNLLGKMSKEMKGFKKLQRDMTALRNLEEKQIKKIVEHLEGGANKTKRLLKQTKDYKGALEGVGAAIKNPSVLLDKFVSLLNKPISGGPESLIGMAKTLFSPQGLLTAGILLTIVSFKKMGFVTHLFV